MLVVKSKSEYSVSIASNTNRLVSSSNDNLGGIRPGTYIKLGNHDNLYSVFKANSFFYLKDFTLINSKTIEIPLNTEVNLQPEDVIKIIYNEYELNSILNISNSGKGYLQDEILTISGGELSIDIREGFGHPTKLKVEEVDDLGRIQRLSLVDKGKYIVPPNGIIEVTSNNGSNLKIDLKYTTIDNHAILNRTIKTLQINDSKTILELDYSLPLGIKNGKLSIEKWEIFLNSPYLYPTSYNLSYKIFKDFTPECSVPLVAKGSNCFEILYNEAMIKFDREIAILKDRINKLENK